MERRHPPDSFSEEGAAQYIPRLVERAKTLVERGAGGDLPEAHHERAMKDIFEIYQLVRRLNDKGDATRRRLIKHSTRQDLLAMGLVLQQLSFVASRLRSELSRSSTLVFLTLFCDYEVDEREAQQSWWRIVRWLDQPWSSALDGCGEDGEGGEGPVTDTGTDTGTDTDTDAERTLRERCDVCEAAGKASRQSKLTWAALDDMALAYYRAALENMRIAVFRLSNMQPTPGPELGELLQDEMALGLASAADAELGQQVFRDLVLSFGMPRRDVRCRRTLLFERHTAHIAEVNHRDMLNRAHNAAMQMPSHVWINGVVELVQQAVCSSDFLGDTEPVEAPVEQQQQVETSDGFLPNQLFLVERSCVLLTGIAMLVAGDVDEARLGDAFGGYVELPFIQTRTMPPGTPRLALVDGEWIYYARAASGAVVVRERGAGLGALLRGATALLDDTRRKTTG